jgi:S-formylglutathione hydrolase
MQKLSENKCFSGSQLRFEHVSKVLHCNMTFSIFLPPQADLSPVPVLYWLSGLTCTDENFVIKAGAQQYAAELGIAIVCPDTSPRGDAVPDDVAGAYDFGLGAGFYVNATNEPWSKHYQMYDYVVKELPTLINESFPVLDNRVSISGHSMGGHGALTIALRNPGRFRSVSAFSPICSPINCPWGQKALTGYLGRSVNEERKLWSTYDAVSLLKKSSDQVKKSLPVLVDQGSEDNFLREQLNTQMLIDVAEEIGYPAQIRFQKGYDHSYFFIASFIGEHMQFHAKHLFG